MKITLKQMEVFIAIAENENMSKAAEMLHLTQSACSMALSNLENQLKGDLFDRHGKRLILNDRGRTLLPKVVNIISQTKELQELMIQDQGKGLVGNLLVGASSTIGNYTLPEIIGIFLLDHPKAKITLKVGNTEQIIQQLLHFEIDIAMIEGRCHHSEIKTIPWLNDQLIIIASPDHLLSKKRKLTLDDLLNAHWILREVGSGTRDYFEEAVQGKITPFLELGHTEAIKQAVKAGLGISCLSRVTVMDALKQGDLVELKTPFLKLARHFYILLHKEKYQTAILNAFFKTMTLSITKK